MHPTTDKVTTHTYNVVRIGGLYCHYHLNPTTIKMLEIGLGCDMRLGVLPLLFGRNYSLKLNYGKQNIRRYMCSKAQRWDAKRYQYPHR
jgi:hypothetical protein